MLKSASASANHYILENSYKLKQFINLSQDLLDEPNMKGTTCRRLLNGLKIKSDLENEKFSHSEESSSFDHSDHEEKHHSGINSIKISKVV